MTPLTMQTNYDITPLSRKQTFNVKTLIVKKKLSYKSCNAYFCLEKITNEKKIKHLM